jgi:predicted nucleic acid-binding Zn ribbon protein
MTFEPFHFFYLTRQVSIAIKSLEMKPKKQKAKFEHIGNILTDVLKTYRRESDGELTQVWQVWDDIVGDVIAQNARPAAFKGKILLVHVSSSTWVHQLQFLKQEMIAKLNDTFGKELISDLKFKIGPLSE